MMMSKNPQQVVQDMIKKNPNLQQAWNQAQQLAMGNKEQAIEQICNAKGISKDEIISQAQNFGINIK